MRLPIARVAPWTFSCDLAVALSLASGRHRLLRRGRGGGGLGVHARRTPWSQIPCALAVVRIALQVSDDPSVNSIDGLEIEPSRCVRRTTRAMVRPASRLGPTSIARSASLSSRHCSHAARVGAENVPSLSTRCQRAVVCPHASRSST
jgi:hypothetical protein